MELILAGGASLGSPTRGFRNRRPQPVSLSRRRFDPQARAHCRIVLEIRHGPENAALSGYWEPVALATLVARLGGLGTARDGPRRLEGSGFQEPGASGFSAFRGGEPGASMRLSVDREPQLTVYSEPIFGVLGTESRGFRNRRARKAQNFQRLRDLSTALNPLTSFYNRVSLNAVAAETSPKTPPRGGFAPAGSLRRFAATPRALTRPPTRHPPIGVGLRPTSYSSSRWFL